MKLNSVCGRWIAALSVGVLCFSSCGQTPSAEPAKTFSSVNMSEAKISVSGLAETLLSEIPFDDPNLIVMEKEIAENLYNIAGLADEVVSYGSTGSTAEAVLVLRCSSEENAAAAREKIHQYRVEMADIYADYNEPESGKLTDALLAADGVYVVFCVSPDAKAAEAAYHTFVTDAVYGAEAEGQSE